MALHAEAGHNYAVLISLIQHMNNVKVYLQLTLLSKESYAESIHIFKGLMKRVCKIAPEQICAFSHKFADLYSICRDISVYYYQIVQLVKSEYCAEIETAMKILTNYQVQVKNKVQWYFSELEPEHEQTVPDNLGEFYYQ